MSSKPEARLERRGRERPGLVVRPASSGELAAAVAFARDHGLRLSVVPGRDAGADTFAAERCLTLDLSRRQPSP